MLAKLKEKLRGKLKSESANDSASSTQTHFIAAFDPESGDIVISSPTRRDLVIASDSDAYEVSHKITCNNENSTFDSDNEVPGCDQSSDPFVEIHQDRMPAEIEPDVSPPTTKNSNPIASVSVEKDVAELGKVPPMVNEKISSPKANQMEVNRDKLRTSISSFDDEILDLDNFDSQEDEESWLVASPAVGNNSEDLLSWLRKDVDKLNPSARRALAQKLEFLIRTQQKKSNDPTVDQSRKANVNDLMSNSATFDCLSSSSGFSSTLNDSTAEEYTGGPTIVVANADRGDFIVGDATEEEFYDAYDNIMPVAGVTPLDGSFLTAGESSNSSMFDESFRDYSQNNNNNNNSSPRNANQSSPTNINTGTFTRPTREKAKMGNGLSPLMNTNISNNLIKAEADSLSASPPPADPTINGSRNALSPGVIRPSGLEPNALNRWPPGSKETSPRPELHPDMHDIQMLASMQEEDLRRCLQDLQLNRRRRTSSGVQHSEETTQNLHTRDVRSNSDAPLDARMAPFLDAQRAGLPSRNQNSPQLMENKLYSSPGRQSFPVNTNTFSRAKAGYKTPMSNADFGQTMVLNRNAKPMAVPQARRPAVPAYKPASPTPKFATGTYNKYKRGGSITDQRVSSLQKSMPNLLATSKSSEFSAVVLNARSADTGSERGSAGDIPSVLSPANSVHEGFEACSPTQSKMSYPGGMSSRLRQPTRLSTPVRTGIPMPAGMRTGIPKPSVPLKMKSTANKSGDDWIEGCF